MGRRPLCVLCLLLMTFLCLADRLGIPLIRGNPLPDNLKTWIREHPESSVCGEVERCVDTEFSQSVYLRDVYLIYNSEKVSIGNLRVYLKKREKEELPAGSVLLVRGKLEEVGEPRNPGEFDSRQYYACRHIYYFMKDGVVEKRSKGYSRYRQFLLDVREKMASILRAASGEAAPVFEAVVLGDKSELENETKMRYQMAGIIHILAISGLHISVLGMGLYGLLKRAGLGIWASGMIALLIMLQYGMMTGGSVSTMRAVCMFLISVGAKILGRIYDMPTALSVAAILILMESPAYLLDGGFWLSFGAVVGVGAVAPRLCRIFGVWGKIGKALVFSAAVQLTTLPVMLWFYGEVSVIGIFLNLVVLPTIGVVLVSGVGTVLGGLVNLTGKFMGSFTEGLIGARICALPGRGLLAVYEGMCVLAGRLPGSTWIGGKPFGWQIGLYYLMFGGVVVAGDVIVRKFGDKGSAVRRGVCLDLKHWKSGVKRLLKWRWGRKRLKMRWQKWSWKAAVYRMFCLGLLYLSVFVLAWHPQHDLLITCLDVGQGDAIVVETPGEHVFLIDGGSSNKKTIGQYQILPFLKSRGISYIDAIFISHTDEDHISGVREILEYMSRGLTSVRAGYLVLPGWENLPEAWRELSALAESAGIEVLTGNKGDIFRMGDLEFRVLSPAEGASGEAVNENAMVMEMDYGDFSALFTGDIGIETEQKLLNELTDVDFLKVAHHGSRHSTAEAFLTKTSPELSVISVSATNTYGHPSPETIERLEACGSRVECTMESGAVTVEIGDDGMEVKRHMDNCGNYNIFLKKVKEDLE